MNHTLKEKVATALATIWDDLESFLKFLYLPIHIPAQTAKKWHAILKDAFPNYLTKLLVLIQTGIESWFSSIEEQLTEKKKKKIFHSLIKKVVMVKHPFLKNWFFSLLFGVMILGLQMISFNTTYSGAEYYFLNLKPWAPVVFAAVIQGSVILLSLTAFDATIKDNRRKVGLAVIVLLSMTFSYVGIINGIVSPLSSYEEEQLAYENLYGDLKHAVLNDGTRAMTRNQAITNIETNLGIVDSWKDAMSKQLNDDSALASLTQTTTNSSTRTDENGNPVTTRSTKTQMVLSEDAILALQQNNTMAQELLTKMNENIPDKDAMSRYFENYDPENEDYETIRSDIAVYNTYFHNWGELQKLIFGEDSTMNYRSVDYIKPEELLKRIEHYDAVNALSAFPADDSSDGSFVSSEPTDAESPQWLLDLKSALQMIFREILNFGSNSTNVYMEQMSQMQNQAGESYRALLPFLEDTEKPLLKSAYDSLLIQKDANVLAFSYFVNGNPHKSSALVALGLAVLVDGGTLGLAILRERKRYSLLYASTRNDFIDEEQDLIAIVLLSMLDIDKNNMPIDRSIPLSEFKYACDEYLANTVKNIHEYLGLFELSDATVEYGFGLVSNDKKLTKEFRPITSLLLELNYLEVLPEWKYQKLVDHFNGSDDIGYTTPQENNGEKVYLLRFRVENYLRSKLTESDIYQNFMGANLN